MEAGVSKKRERSRAELAAQVRALKKQGARIAADRDRAWDHIAEMDDGVLKLIAVVVQQRKDNEQLLAALTKCQDGRHKLLMKLKEARAGNK